MIFIDECASLDGVVASRDDDTEIATLLTLCGWLLFNCHVQALLHVRSSWPRNADDAYVGQVVARTGAIVIGHRTWRLLEHLLGSRMRHSDIPWFVVAGSSGAAAPEPSHNVHVVTGAIQTVIAEAGAAAGDRDVQVLGGIDVWNQVLRASAVDVLTTNSIPVTLQRGYRRDAPTPEPAEILVEKMSHPLGIVRSIQRFRR